MVSSWFNAAILLCRGDAVKVKARALPMSESSSRKQTPNRWVVFASEAHEGGGFANSITKVGVGRTPDERVVNISWQAAYIGL
jgi:hypothetical protein